MAGSPPFVYEVVAGAVGGPVADLVAAVVLGVFSLQGEWAERYEMKAEGKITNLRLLTGHTGDW